MNPIDTLFQTLRSRKQKAFIPFVTAGDPDVATSLALVKELAKRGASLIEIGFPYSDPIADGSVIQASYTRALNAGLRIEDNFRLATELRREEPFRSGQVPLVAMVSFSLVHHRGAEKFMKQAQEAGFSGAIVPDLPVEESADLAKIAAGLDFKLIHLVTPTTPRDRALLIARRSSGFLYCVSVVGITGERSQIPPELFEQLRWLRTQTDLPLCVGFGISKPEHVQLLRDFADGIIVGSALVRGLENVGKQPASDVVRAIADLAQGLAEALAGAAGSEKGL